MDIKQRPNVIIRSYRSGDEAGIIELFQRCFSTSMSPALWQWKYEKNPLGNGFIQVAEIDGRIVAHYGAYPVAVCVGGRRIGSALHIGDVMTDPGVRGLGFGRNSVITRVVRAFYERHCADKVLFNYGAPSFRHLRLGRLFFDYATIGAVQEWVLHKSTSARGRRSRLRKKAILGRCRLVADRTVDTQAVGELFVNVGRHLPMTVERAPSYLRWRYHEHPAFFYRQYGVYQDDRLLLWAVTRNADDEVWIGDLLVDPRFPDAFRLLIAHLLGVSRARALRLWSPAVPGWWAALLMKLGFRPRSHPLQIRTAFTFFDTTTVSALRMNKDWFYAMGDFDLF